MLVWWPDGVQLQVAQKELTLAATECDISFISTGSSHPIWVTHVTTGTHLLSLYLNVQ